jgi:hypothetical protein
VSMRKQENIGYALDWAQHPALSVRHAESNWKGGTAAVSKTGWTGFVMRGVMSRLRDVDAPAIATLNSQWLETLAVLSSGLLARTPPMFRSSFPMNTRCE